MKKNMIKAISIVFMAVIMLANTSGCAKNTAQLNGGGYVASTEGYTVASNVNHGEQEYSTSASYTVPTLEIMEQCFNYNFTKNATQRLIITGKVLSSKSYYRNTGENFIENDTKYPDIRAFTLTEVQITRVIEHTGEKQSDLKVGDCVTVLEKYSVLPDKGGKVYIDPYEYPERLLDIGDENLFFLCIEGDGVDYAREHLVNVWRPVNMFLLDGKSLNSKSGGELKKETAKDKYYGPYTSLYPQVIEKYIKQTYVPGSYVAPTPSPVPAQEFKTENVQPLETTLPDAEATKPVVVDSPQPTASTN